MGNLNDLTGKRFGQWEVLSRHSASRSGATMWMCRCDCGNETAVGADHLIRGNTTSCGKHKPVMESNPRWKGYGNVSGHHYAQIRHGATRSKRRPLEFDVSIEYLSDLFDIQQGECALTGEPLVIKVPGKEENRRTASLDRIDSGLGYVEGNVQWVHKEINIMKNNLDQERFQMWCSLVTRKCELPKMGA